MTVTLRFQITCTNCATLQDENLDLKRKICELESLVLELRTCSSTSHRDRSPAESKTLVHTPDVNHDHQYASTPRSLRRKLHRTHVQNEKVVAEARCVKKKFHRATMKLSKLKNILRRMKEDAIAQPEVIDHLEKVFCGTPLQFYERVIYKNSAGKKKSTKQYSTDLRAFALSFHFYSPRAYAFVSEEFRLCLPHPRTLRSRYNVVKGDPGLTQESFSALQMKVHEYKAAGKN